jgi:hypothetical protein
VKRAAFLAAACALYVLVAWSVKPGFYDCCAAPQYDYVSPPPDLAPYNTPPTSGSDDVGAAGGVVTTRDQPIAQAAVRVGSGPAHIEIQPYAVSHPQGITLEGNVYCVASGAALGSVQLSLLVPPTEPFPSAMYEAPSRDGPWRSIGGSVDLSTYLMSAQAPALGCFAVGYPTPKRGGPGITGSLLPPVVAVLIAIVLLAGLPIAVRRRYNRPRVPK